MEEVEDWRAELAYQYEDESYRNLLSAAPQSPLGTLNASMGMQGCGSPRQANGEKFGSAGSIMSATPPRLPFPSGGTFSPSGSVTENDSITGIKTVRAVSATVDEAMKKNPIFAKHEAVRYPHLSPTELPPSLNVADYSLGAFLARDVSSEWMFSERFGTPTLPENSLIVEDATTTAARISTVVASGDPESISAVLPRPPPIKSLRSEIVSPNRLLLVASPTRIIEKEDSDIGSPPPGSVTSEHPIDDFDDLPPPSMDDIYGEGLVWDKPDVLKEHLDENFEDIAPTVDVISEFGEVPDCLSTVDNFAHTDKDTVIGDDEEEVETIGFSPNTWGAPTGFIVVDEMIARLRFLDALARTYAEQVVSLRSSVRQQGEYLYALQRPVDDDELLHTQTVVRSNLEALREDSRQLIEELSFFQIQRVAEAVTDEELTDALEAVTLAINSVPSDAVDEHAKKTLDRAIENQERLHDVAMLRDQLTELCRVLSEEAVLTMLSIEQLADYALGLCHYPSGNYLLSDTTYTSWQQLDRFQRKALRSRRCLEYIAYMSSHQLPICSAIHEYLQNPDGYGYEMIVRNYTFAFREMEGICDYLRRDQEIYPSRTADNEVNKAGSGLGSLWSNVSSPEKQVVISRGPHTSVLHGLSVLVMCNCNLRDSDFYPIVEILPSLTALRVLNMSNNRIGYSGIASLAACLYENTLLLEQLSFEGNQINSEGASLLAQVLNRMPNLISLSLAKNHIGDSGAANILSATLNRHRRAYTHVPPVSAVGVLKDEIVRAMIRGKELPLNGEAALLDNHVSNDDYYDFEESADEILVEPRERKKYPKNCYLQDFFAPQVTQVVSEGNMRRKSLKDQTTNGEDALEWLNEDFEEFDLGGVAAYSDDEDEQEEDNRCWLHSCTLSYGDMLRLYDPSSNSPPIMEQEETSRYPRLVRLFLRVRIRIAAVVMFRSLSRRGSTKLSSINLSACNLSQSMLPPLLHVLMDNTSLTEVRLAGNSRLLETMESCRLMAALIPRTNLVHLDMENTGLTDTGLLLLSRSLSATRSINSVNLSSNRLGPTGANVLATLAQDFVIDGLCIGAGIRKVAPAIDASNITWSDWMVTEREVAAFGRRRRRRQGNQSTETRKLIDEDNEDLTSFVDLDALSDSTDEEEDVDHDTDIL